MTKRFPYFLLLVMLVTFLSNPAELCAQVTVDSSVQVIEEPVVDTTAVYDDEYEEEEEVEVFDTTLHRSIWVYSSDSVRSFRSQKEFEYMKELDSLLKKRQELLLQEQKKQRGKRVVNIFPFIEVLLWTLLIGALLFVLYRVFLSDRGLFASPLRNKKLLVEEEKFTDDVYLDQQLQQAIKEGNYRLGIRFLYLQSLNKLSERGWLQLSPDKTNYQYVRELAKPQLKNTFSRITLHYEYAWYGDFVIEQHVFEPIKKEFEQFHQTIKQS
ncbi:DUF4129 domain-containing protein [Lacibacter sediminis]|uniref:DUF4129 domain-containing protein n=1 Tax=Lacibacter sediminis TaxID=2760713 RepID=A0A7G5XB77_9BACT|nr:DUF4129 domain-containing protein [Lacibacter sediminis]QNA42730.1 DUF4129 domain-containing protein [Lacibacter sediminis]